MRWKFFLGASFLTGALVIPHAGPRPVIFGVVRAFVVQLAWSYVGGGQ